MSRVLVIVESRVRLGPIRTKTHGWRAPAWSGLTMTTQWLSNFTWVRFKATFITIRHLCSTFLFHDAWPLHCVPGTKNYPGILSKTLLSQMIGPIPSLRCALYYST
ncbi:hypothetical protein BDR05DRAFT_966637 [Suillus weaverae]|nr:hypothetical protein BDR05DRAFT_966637 [Suillus weaverae]